MSYLVDTDVCIAMLRGRSSWVRRRLEETLSRNELVFTSAVTRFELWSGIEMGDGRPAQVEDLEDLGRLVPVLPWVDGDARVAAKVRAALRRQGTAIGPYDLLIGAQALARGLTLVTNNAREFGRIEGLRTANWLNQPAGPRGRSVGS